MPETLRVSISSRLSSGLFPHSSGFLVMHFGPKEAASIAKVLNRAGDSCRRKGSWDLIHAPVRSPNMSRPEKRSHSCYSNLQQLSITAKSGALSLLSSAEVTWSSGHIPLPSWHWSSWQLHLPVTCGTSNQLILLKVHSKKDKTAKLCQVHCSVKSWFSHFQEAKQNIRKQIILTKLSPWLNGLANAQWIRSRRFCQDKILYIYI